MPPGQDSPYRGNYASLPVVTLKPPSEGNRTVPVVILWQRDGVSPSYTIHFNARAQQVVSLSQIAALHIDNTQCSSTINIVFPDTQFQLQLGPNSEGFYPVVTNSLEFYAYIDLAPTINDRSVIQVLNFLPPPIEFGSAGGQGVGAGTVRQVDTVAPLQGGPITDQGTLSLSVPLPLNIGGTGAITANAALDNLSNTSGATAGSLSRSAGGLWTVSAGAGTGTISAVNPGTGITGGGTSGAVTVGLQVPVTVANGGTGATTAAQALTNLAAAPLAAPAFSGAPTAPTASPGTNTTQLATTAFVTAATLTAGGAYVPLTGAVPMSGPLNISQNPTIPAASGALLHLTANNSQRASATIDTFGNSSQFPEFAFRFARGTAAAPALPQSADILGDVSFSGWTGAGYTPTGAAQIYAATTEAWSGTGHGAYLTFTTTPTGTLTPSVPMLLGQGVIVGGGLPNDPGPGCLSVQNTSNFGGRVTVILPAGSSRVMDLISQQTAQCELGFTVANVRNWTASVGTGGIFGIRDETGAAYRLLLHLDGSSQNTTGTWSAISDITLKENVTDYKSGLEQIKQLRPVEFGWKNKDHGPEKNWGLVAQEVENVMPELVGECNLAGADEEPDIKKTVDPGRAIFALINAVKELAAQVSELQAKVGT